MFSQEKPSKELDPSIMEHVPEKYRKAFATGDGKELNKVFSKECSDILAGSDDQFSKIIADINNLKNEMVSGVRKERQERETAINSATAKLKAEMEMK